MIDVTFTNANGHTSFGRHICANLKWVQVLCDDGKTWMPIPLYVPIEYQRKIYSELTN